MNEALIALIAILGPPGNNQRLFVQSDLLYTLLNPLKEKNVNVIKLLTDFYSAPSAAETRNHRATGEILNITLGFALEATDQLNKEDVDKTSRIIKLLGLIIKGNQKLCERIKPNIIQFVTMATSSQFPEIRASSVFCIECLMFNSDEEPMIVASAIVEMNGISKTLKSYDTNQSGIESIISLAKTCIISKKQIGGCFWIW